MNVQSLVDMVKNSIGVTFRASNPHENDPGDAEKATLYTTSGETMPVALKPVRLAGDGPGGDFDRTAVAFKAAVLEATKSVPRDEFTVVVFQNVPVPITTEDEGQAAERWHATVRFGVVRDQNGSDAAAAVGR